jgi:uncharacterized protein (DUF1778 family)/ribosomal protein S18 acetylase RimI-like enzyme
MASARRTKRLELRVTPVQKRNIERAASLRGTSVTDFVLNEVHSAAIATINEFEALELRDDDRRMFIKALLNPPKPSEALRTAAARHKAMGLWSLADNLRIEPLGGTHDRAAFSSDSPPLDQYLKNQARQAIEKNLAVVFVLTSDGTTILGYYTLSSFVVKLNDIPETIAKKLTKIGEVPATLIGRLARSINLKGKGIGEILLTDALKKALHNAATVASWAVVVDAKDNKAIAFYKRYGFLEFPNTPNRLFLPINTIRELFSQNEEPPPAAQS